MKSVYTLLAVCVFASSVVCYDFSKDIVRTPYGLFHKSCVLHVPTGTIIHHADIGFSVTFPNGTHAKYEECQFKLPTTTDINSWDGWEEHVWFGLNYASWTNPPLTEDVTFFSTNWNIPNTPENTLANMSSPWPYSPTLSTWIGLQGPVVLQPVLEFNGLTNGEWDLASWNCCPSGYTVHSDPITGIEPGQQLYGEISSTSTDVYNILSAVTGGASTVLTADMRGLSGWSPLWIEAIMESYYVTQCDQLPSNPSRFYNITVQLSSGNLAANEIPWQQDWICASTPCSSLMCNGDTGIDSQTGDVAVGYTASSCQFSKVQGYIPTGSDVFTGYYSVEDAMNMCANMSVCAGITLQNVNSNDGSYMVFGKSYSIVENNSSWISYIKSC